MNKRIVQNKQQRTRIGTHSGRSRTRCIALLSANGFRAPRLLSGKTNTIRTAVEIMLTTYCCLCLGWTTNTYTCHIYCWYDLQRYTIHGHHLLYVPVSWRQLPPLARHTPTRIQPLVTWNLRLKESWTQDPLKLCISVYLFISSKLSRSSAPAPHC
jgi:hypothetical protein